ncbi:MAG TPA: SGNH/GDSL hydrolase family protein [Pyrinomonadaceae bacterium]
MNITKRGRARRLLANLPLIVLGIVIGVVLAEIGLRLIGYTYPEFYQPDNSKGYALRPGMHGWYRKEGEAYVQINSDGLRDVEHERAKPGDTIRIAVLGDSYAEAFQVSKEQAFWSIMEEKLSQCGAFAGKRVEVLNFGVSGYGTAQQLITLRERVWTYSPDIVMLTVTTNNDIVDNSRALKKTDEIPYYVVSNDQLVLDDSFQDSRSFIWRQSRINRLGRWIRDHSRVIQTINQAHHGFKILLASWKKRSRSAEPPKGETAQPTPANKSDVVARSEELGTDNVIYIEPQDSVWNDAWQVTEKLIVALRDEVQDHGAKFVVVTLSNGPQVLPDRNAREFFMKRFGVTDLFYPDNRIKELGSRESIPTITLAPELQEYAEQNKVYLHGFGETIGNGHWNQAGHRIAGELLARKMCEPF